MSLFLSRKDRAEAKTRALNYAEYYLNLYGPAAELEVREKLRRDGLTRFRRLLLRHTLREIDLLRNRLGIRGQ